MVQLWLILVRLDLSLLIWSDPELLGKIEHVILPRSYIKHKAWARVLDYFLEIQVFLPNTEHYRFGRMSQISADYVSHQNTHTSTAGVFLVQVENHSPQYLVLSRFWLKWLRCASRLNRGMNFSTDISTQLREYPDSEK